MLKVGRKIWRVALPALLVLLMVFLPFVSLAEGNKGDAEVVEFIVAEDGGEEEGQQDETGMPESDSALLQDDKERDAPEHDEHDAPVYEYEIVEDGITQDELDEASADAVIERYIRENIDESIAGEVEMMDIVNVFLVKNTLVDGRITPRNYTIDDVMFSPNFAHLIFAILEAVVPVYVINDGDYYVSFINTMQNDAYRLQDWIIARNDLTGTTLGDETIFDANAGILYIPKNLYINEDNVYEVLGIQAQLLQSVTAGMDSQSVVEVVDITEDEIEHVIVAEDIFSLETIVETQAGLNKNTLEISVNGLVLDDGDFYYDVYTGELILPIPPSSIVSVSVEINDDGLPPSHGLSDALINSMIPVIDLPISAYDSAADDWFYYDNQSYFNVEMHQKVESGTVHLFKNITSAFIRPEYEHHRPNAVSTWYLPGYDIYNTFWHIVDDGVYVDVSRFLRQSQEANHNQHNFAYNIGNSARNDAITFGTGLASNGGETNAAIFSCAHINHPYFGAGPSVATDGGSTGIFWNYSLDVGMRYFNMDHERGRGIVGVVTQALMFGINDQAGVGFFQIRWAPRGSLEIQKVSDNPGMTNGNSLYSLAGAEFDVYNNSGALAGKIVTGANGIGRLENVPKGTNYYVIETKAPPGFAIENSGTSSEGRIYFDIEGGKATVVRVTNIAQNDPGRILLRKLDADSGTGNPSGGARLAGGEFLVRFYGGGYYTTEAQLAGRTPMKSWVIKTDEGGIARLDPAHFVSGDTFWYDIQGDIVLGIGTVTIQEVKAPDGYIIDDTLHIRHIRSGGIMEEVDSYNPPSIPNKVILGGISIQKRDHETGLDVPQGGATFAGTQFEIFNRNTGSVRVGGVDYAPGAIVALLTTGADGRAEIDNDLLPYGDYEIIECTPPQGYLHEGVLSRAFQIRTDGAIVDMTSEDNAIRNDIIRGDFRGLKIAGDTHERLANVPFRITSITTGESHVIITDDNGEFSTASSWAAHSQNTNRGEASEDGVWFGDLDALDDTKGALPYDTYLIEELSAESNEGYEPISLLVMISRNNHIVNFGTLVNHKLDPPFSDLPLSDSPRMDSIIGTSAFFTDTGEREAIASSSASVVDTVFYSGLEPGLPYTVIGMLMDKASGAPLIINGEEVVAQTSFVPLEASGTVEVAFEFDATGLDGSAIVLFEWLYQDGLIVAEHTDLNEELQTIVFSGFGVPQTGYGGLPFWMLYAAGGLLLAAVSCMVCFAYGKRRRDGSC